MYGHDILTAGRGASGVDALTNPEFSGPPWEIRDGDFLRYRCRVGHTVTASEMIQARSEQLEQGLLVTLNQLEESVSLSSKIAGEARTRVYARGAASFEEKPERSRRRAELIRQALQDDATTETVEVDERPRPQPPPHSNSPTT